MTPAEATPLTDATLALLKGRALAASVGAYHVRSDTNPHAVDNAAGHVIAVFPAADATQAAADAVYYASLDAGTVLSLIDEIERLRAALEFYANPANHSYHVTAEALDHGECARAALAGPAQEVRE